LGLIDKNGKHGDLMKLVTQENYKKNASKGLKSIAGMNTIIHCHH
jgi:hypothetical protein